MNGRLRLIGVDIGGTAKGDQDVTLVPAGAVHTASMAYDLAVLNVGGGAGAAAGFSDSLMWPTGTIPHRSAVGDDLHDPSRGMALFPNGPVATKGALVPAGRALTSTKAAIGA